MNIWNDLEEFVEVKLAENEFEYLNGDERMLAEIAVSGCVEFEAFFEDVRNIQGCLFPDGSVGIKAQADVTATGTPHGERGLVSDQIAGTVNISIYPTGEVEIESCDDVRLCFPDDDCFLEDDYLPLTLEKPAAG